MKGTKSAVSQGVWQSHMPAGRRAFKDGGARRLGSVPRLGTPAQHLPCRVASELARLQREGAGLSRDGQLGALAQPAIGVWQDRHLLSIVLPDRVVALQTTYYVQGWFGCLS